jgi:ribulose-5-phosphate 4-epimerase/fuculose-1-phosphate aldolase
LENFFDKNKAELENFAMLSQSVGARADYVQGGGGNTSVKLKDGLMAIKASGYKLSDIRTDAAYAVINNKAVVEFFETHEMKELADVEKTGADFVKSQILAIEGLAALRPSVEVGFHSLLDCYVAHSHSVYANLATCVLEGREIVQKALADAPYTWGFVPYTDPGTCLSFFIRDELRRVTAETGKRPAVIFMQNHGLIVHSNDAKAALEINDDVNARIAGFFGLPQRAFPTISLAQAGEGLLASDTPFIRECLLSGQYDESFFIDRPLYPDQMVFLIGTFSMGENAPDSDCCVASAKNGQILYRMSAQKAQTIEETLAAVLFITENAKRCGYTLCGMGDAAKRFIANWESERYRKTLSGTTAK